MNKMTNTIWSDAVNLEFVKLYLKHECLWNPVHPLYKLKYIRKKAHAEIISEFKTKTNISITVAESANKIKNLRSGYGNKLNKIDKKKKMGRTYTPYASWFHEMDRYLKSVPGHRHAIIHSQQTPDDFSEEDDKKTCPIKADNKVHTNFETEDSDSSPSNTQQTDKECDNNVDQELKVKFEVLQSPLQCSTMEKPLDTYTENEIEDEFSIYGKFIASHLRKMSPQNALKLELQIQTLISESNLSDSHI